MTTGNTRYADISSLVMDVYEAAFLTLHEQNLLLPTVTRMSGGGMQPRKSTTYGTLNARAASEGEDITPTNFARSLAETLTPSRVADQVLLTDERIMTDPENVRADAAMELASTFAEKVDADIVAAFPSLTGGTQGTTGGTITLTMVSRAVATLRTGKVPGPYYCVLHPYQWQRIYEGVTAGSTSAFGAAPAFQDRLVQNYFTTPLIGGVIFVVSANVTVSSNNATGAIYNPAALAYDERDPFTIEPQRDASRGAWELNANLRYATGVWRPTFGVQLIGLATNPT